MSGHAAGCDDQWILGCKEDQGWEDSLAGQGLPVQAS